MKLRAILLGSGCSMGVPRLGGADGRGDWGACDPNEPRNLRTRCSLIVQRAHSQDGWDTPHLTTILVDTAPELRLQLLRESIARIDAVLISHDHADQTHGIDDVRPLCYRAQRPLPMHFDPVCAPALLERFAYCFVGHSQTSYPPILHPLAFRSGDTFSVDGPSGVIPVQTIEQTHGAVMSTGFIFGAEGGIAYSPDVNLLSDDALMRLSGVDLWIVDCLRYAPHPSHAHLAMTLEWIAQVRPTRAVLTNLHGDLDYRALTAQVPRGVEVGFDGLRAEVTVPPGTAP